MEISKSPDEGMLLILLPYSITFFFFDRKDLNMNMMHYWPL